MLVIIRIVNPDKVSVVVPVPVALVPSAKVPSDRAVDPTYHLYANSPVLVSLSICPAGNVAVAIPIKVAIPDATLQEVPTG